ncbi:sulfatase [Mycolicibacterium sp. J2]|uniref:sulfatase family protein n=1 Tax=Mycolicibacterium sp. J2 TaxID=2993511 RepID=UPI00224A98DB|nr:sulfatase-like hydrolase/transferase [Mycolicibacterium sp. J2]MCX2714033.1 sulfatase-like hydrolase/transferase [Mycolicibacterium sp. J2]
MSESPSRPNIVLIVCDQLRADHVGFGGSSYIRTPHLDRLARSGTTFSNAYVANPICMPNRASLLTGRMPSSHGVVANAGALFWTANTLPRTMREAGYRTALVGKADLQNGIRRIFDPTPTSAAAVGDPFPPGWDRLEDPDRYHGVLQPDPKDFYGFERIALTLGHADAVGGHHLRWALAQGASLEDLSRVGPQHARYVNEHWWQIYQPHLPAELYSTTFVTETSIATINEFAAGDRPWFLECSFPDPHHPFTAPGDWHFRHHARDMALPARYHDHGVDAPSHLNEFRSLDPAGLVRMFGPTPEQVRAAAAAEAGAIEFLDHSIGRILHAVGESGQADNTIVVFTADHGDMFGDHGLMLKGMMHYAGCTRIPLIFNGPNISPRCTQALASTIDIAPTILQLAQIAPYQDIHGTNLIPSSAADQTPERTCVYIEEDFPQAGMFAFPVPSQARTLITDRYRLTRYTGNTDAIGEIYDLTDDPTESINRFNDPAYATVRGELTDQLVDHVTRLSAPAPLGPLTVASETDE